MNSIAEVNFMEEGHLNSIKALSMNRLEKVISLMYVNSCMTF